MLKLQLLVFSIVGTPPCRYCINRWIRQSCSVGRAFISGYTYIHIIRDHLDKRKLSVWVVQDCSQTAFLNRYPRISIPILIIDDGFLGFFPFFLLKTISSFPSGIFVAWTSHVFNDLSWSFVPKRNRATKAIGGKSKGCLQFFFVYLAGYAQWKSFTKNRETMYTYDIYIYVYMRQIYVFVTVHNFTSLKQLTWCLEGWEAISLQNCQRLVGPYIHIVVDISNSVGCFPITEDDGIRGHVVHPSGWNICQARLPLHLWVVSGHSTGDLGEVFRWRFKGTLGLTDSHGETHGFPRSLFRFGASSPKKHVGRDHVVSRKNLSRFSEEFSKMKLESFFPNNKLRIGLGPGSFLLKFVETMNHLLVPIRS